MLKKSYPKQKLLDKGYNWYQNKIQHHIRLHIDPTEFLARVNLAYILKLSSFKT